MAATTRHFPTSSTPSPFEVAFKTAMANITHPVKITDELNKIADGFVNGSRPKEELCELLKIVERDYTRPHDPTLENLLGHIAHGFAEGRTKQETYEFFEMVKRDYPHKIYAVLTRIATGFAKKKPKEESLEFFEIVKRKHPDYIRHVLISMAREFGQYKPKEDVWELLDIVKRDHLDAFGAILLIMAEEFATYKSKKETYEFLTRIRIDHPDQNTPSLLIAIADGLSSTEHKEDARELLKIVMSNPLAQIAEMLPEIATCCAQAGSQDEMYALLPTISRDYPDEVRQRVVRNMADGFINVGHTEKAYQLLTMVAERNNHDETQDLVESMTTKFMQYEDTKEAYEFLTIVEESYPDHIDTALLKIADCKHHYHGGCIDKAIVLRSLTIMEDPDSRERLVSHLKGEEWEETVVSAYDPTRLLPKATAFNACMKQQDISYNQLLGWTQPEMQLFLLRGQFIANGRLAAPLFLSIITYLCPVTYAEAQDLLNKFKKQISCSARFFKEQRILTNTAPIEKRRRIESESKPTPGLVA